MAGLALVACFFALALPATASLGASTAASCTAGSRKVGGLTVRDFCGPAQAIVHVGNRTLTIKNGVCSQAGPIYSINIGSITLGTTKGKYLYFGANVNALRGGTFHNAAIAFQYPGGSGFLWKNTLKLSASKHRGTFSGWTSRQPKWVTGSFTC